MMVRLLPVALLAVLFLAALVDRAAARPVLGATAAQGRGVSTPVVRPAPLPERDVVAAGEPVRDVWSALADCESDGRWAYNGPSGFDGGLQFHPATWAEFAPDGFPPFAWQASRGEQIAVAERVLAVQGWSAWPACSRKVGLR